MWDGIFTDILIAWKYEHLNTLTETQIDLVLLLCLWYVLLLSWRMFFLTAKHEG